MNDIFEAIRTQIKSKIPNERVVGDQVVSTNREEILNSIPFHTKRVVVKLQENSILPPKVFSFFAGEEKKTFSNKNGDELFDYIKLPEDFLSIDSFEVENYEIDFEYFENEYALKRFAVLKNKPLYKDARIEIEGNFQNILAFAPFPEDDETVYVKYVFLPDEEYIRNIEEKYWNAIIAGVEARLGLTDKYSAEEEAAEVSGNWKQTGKRRSNIRTRNHYRNIGTRNKSRRV